MRNLILTSLIITISNLCFSQDLKMELDINTCVDASANNMVTFNIENLTGSDIWIRPDFLTFYFGIYSKDEKRVPRKTTRHLDRMAFDLLKIEKNSKIKIEWTTSYFDNLKFEINKEYYIESGYQPPGLRRKEKKNLLKSNVILTQKKFSGKSNIFKICKI